MQNETEFTTANRLFSQIGATLRNEGQEIKLKAGIQLSHVPIRDTALAACCLILGIPLREPGPFTDDVLLDAKGNEQSRGKYWWLGASSGNSDDAHKTEEMAAAWQFRATFEAKYPAHPLTVMRQAFDARAFWLDVIHGRPIERGKTKGIAYSTTSLREACVLKAAGFVPIALNDRAFLFEPVLNFRRAEDVLINSGSLAMTAPEQWHRRVLHVFDEMIRVAKSQAVIIREPFDDQTLLLTADSTPRTREKFHRLIE